MLEAKKCGGGDKRGEEVAGEVEIAGFVAVVVVYGGDAVGVEWDLFTPGEGNKVFEILEAVDLEEVVPVKIDGRQMWEGRDINRYKRVVG